MWTGRGAVAEKEQPTETARHYLKEFVDEIRSLPSGEKAGQIGLEPMVLGIPQENVTFARAKSYFLDPPFDTAEVVKGQKEWLEFRTLPSPLNIIAAMPELTLFFMFYAQPYDLIQVASSEELQNRGWAFTASDARWTRENDQGETFEFNLHSWSIKKTNVCEEET